MEKEPKNIPFIDLGKNGTCTMCDKRYCICKKRQESKENHLPIKTIKN